MLDDTLRIIKKIIPRKIFTRLQPAYHFALAFLGNVIYRNPSRHITLIGITGTKGKTTTAELINAVFEEAGYKTALAGTLRIKIGEKSQRNLYKMTMPGRFFVQKFLREAVDNGCSHAIIEMTSEGAKQFRHLFLEMNALVFTNLSPEHIESHGSYEKYRDAKLRIAGALERSRKKKRVLVVNKDDQEAEKFLSVNVPEKRTYSLSSASPYMLHEKSTEFTFNKTKLTVHMPGVFNIYNALGAATLARAFNISEEVIRKALEKFTGARGRMEYVEAGQNFSVVVDYAHTPDSLTKAYEALGGKKRICVLGGTGGGRDTWKRKEMGQIADTHCDHIILTNEDPYDENPLQIVGHIKDGVQKTNCEIIMDRREALRKAFVLAHEGDTVIITGKGTDPYIMEANGKKTPWDDATVAREELELLTTHQKA